MSMLKPTVLHMTSANSPTSSEKQERPSYLDVFPVRLFMPQAITKNIPSAANQDLACRKHLASPLFLHT